MNFLFWLRKKLQLSMQITRTPAEQGRLPWRLEVAALDAGFGVGTRIGQTRCITVTRDHSVPVSLQARVGTLVGRPLRGHKGREQNYCDGDKEHHESLFPSVHGLRPP